MEKKPTYEQLEQITNQLRRVLATIAENMPEKDNAKEGGDINRIVPDAWAAYIAGKWARTALANVADILGELN